MVRRIDWENQIGRRLKLRDLHVFITVADCGAMAKAAAKLGVSQPAVSEVVADLESALGVRLFDRTVRGVEMTVYGEALRRRIVAAFDELKQGVRDLEAISDPSSGSIYIGSPLPLMATIIAPVVQRFSQAYPRVQIFVDDIVSPASDLLGLRARKHDLVLARLTPSSAPLDDDIQYEIMFRDQLVVATGVGSRLLDRDGLTLADLHDEQWVMTPPESWNTRCLDAAFRKEGLGLPEATVVTTSMPLRVRLLSAGTAVAAFPVSVIEMNHERFPITALPIDLADEPWPVAIFTLKNRISNPLVERFVAVLRDFTGDWQGRIDKAMENVMKRRG